MRILLLAAACLLAVPAGASAADARPKPGKAKKAAAPVDDSDLPPAWKPEENPQVKNLPAFLGIFGPTSLVEAAGFLSAPGRWIEYEFVTLDESIHTGPTMRIQQVGPAPQGKRWLEMTVQGDGIGDSGIRILTAGEGRGNIERVIAKGPGMPPMEMPLNGMVMSEDGEALSGFSRGMEGKLRLVGRETVNVPLGTFEADHYVVEKDGKTGDYWVATDSSVPFVRVVKFSTVEGVAIARAMGSDAKSVIPAAARTK